MMREPYGTPAASRPHRIEFPTAATPQHVVCRHREEGGGHALGLIPHNIDISGTPFTNTLPIRRNRDWVIGEPRRFNMAWVPLDTLEPFQDGQIYTPLGDNRWRYQAADGSFEAEILVDDDGLVVDYPGLFRRAQ